MGRLRDWSLARVLVGVDRSEVLEGFADFLMFRQFDAEDFWDVLDDLGAVFFVGEEVRELGTERPDFRFGIGYILE